MAPMFAELFSDGKGLYQTLRKNKTYAEVATRVTLVQEVPAIEMPLPNSTLLDT
jgi:hypothetical protein